MCQRIWPKSQIKMSSWIRFNPVDTDIETFLIEKAPSKVLRNKGFSWIYVRSGLQRKGRREDDISCDGLSVSGHQSYQIICELAEACSTKTGKWLVFESEGNKVDKVWSDIAKATLDGKLGDSAKVSTRENGNTTHVICVYNDDFTDKHAVLKVEKGLRSLNISGILNYKPDVFTDLGIYVNNEFGLSPTLYTSKFNPMTGFVVRFRHDDPESVQALKEICVYFFPHGDMQWMMSTSAQPNFSQGESASWGETSTSTPPQPPGFICSNCDRDCHSRIGLYSHSRRCIKDH